MLTQPSLEPLASVAPRGIHDLVVGLKIAIIVYYFELLNGTVI